MLVGVTVASLSRFVAIVAVGVVVCLVAVAPVIGIAAVVAVVAVLIEWSADDTDTGEEFRAVLKSMCPTS